MRRARGHRIAIALVAAGAMLAGCGSGDSTPVISPAPPASAPAVIPTDWTQSTVSVPGEEGGATYTAPRNRESLAHAAVVLGGGGPGSDVATKQIVVMLAHAGVATLLTPDVRSGAADFRQVSDRAQRALAALAQSSGLADDRLLAVGHGLAAPAVVALGTGSTSGGATRAPRPVALIEPVLGGPESLPGAPAPDRAIVDMATAQSSQLGKRKHDLITCSDADVAVDCGQLQGLADLMMGTHVNYVRLRGVSHSLQEDASRDPARYGSIQTPFSAALNASLGTWVSMQ